MISHNIARKLAALVSRDAGLPAERAQGTVTRVDDEGTVWVQLFDGEEETPCAASMVAVHEGDVVSVTIDNGTATVDGNATRPATDDAAAQEARVIADKAAEDVASVAAELPRVRTAASSIAQAAQGIAAEAQAIAAAVNQHFFADGNGIHVTEAAGDATTEHNVLINSLGFLLRKATAPLMALSASAVAFYDGLGDTAANIIARFGADGSQIGRSGESHVELDYHSMQMVDKEGTTYFYVSDLRDASGLYETVDTFTGDGTKRVFALSFAASSNDYTVKVDGVEVTSGISRETYQVIFTTAPSDGAVVTVEYATTSERAKAYTLGFRASGSKVGPMSFAEGINVTASGQVSHAEGSYTESANQACHAEGIDTVASGLGAHSEGIYTVASGSYSHAQNNHTIAAKPSQTALGTYNVEDTATTTTHPSGATYYGQYALIIGNGTSNSNRSNALAVDWSGNVWSAGKATLTGAVEAASAAITGALSAASASISGAISAASATITGTLTAGDLATSSDVPWTLLTLDSACHAYNDATANAPRYRRWGQLVTVTGIIAPTSEVASGGTLAIATLPAGVRPHQQINIKCQGSGRSHWCLNITAAGVTTASRYGDENGAQAMGTGIWMPFTVTYLV